MLEPRSHPFHMPGSGLARPRPQRLAALIVLGLTLVAWGVTLAPPGLVATSGLTVGMTLVLAAAGLWAVDRSRAGHVGDEVSMIERFITQDPAPAIVTDSDGVIRLCNAAARGRYPATEAGGTLAGTLRAQIANPAALLYRLRQRALAAGAAQEDAVCRSGQIRVAVQALGADSLLWRIEQVAARTEPDAAAVAHDLPTLHLGPDDRVLSMNDAAARMIGSRPDRLDRLFVSLPLRPGEINALTTATGPVEVVVAGSETAADRRAIHWFPLPAAGRETHAGVFETLPVPLIKLRRDGTILSANRMALGLIGNNGARPRRIDDALQGLGRPMQDWIKDTLTRHPVPQAEVLRMKIKDQEKYVQVTLTRAMEDGEAILIGVLNDATELKTLEAQFVQSQKMQAIGQLAGGVAHDFNNLLTAISGHCDLLLLRHDQHDPDYGDLIQIHQNANRAAALVGQLLAFSRKQTLRPEVLDLRETLADLTHLLNRLVGERVRLIFDHDPVLRPIRVDKRQLEQVIMNLVVNARDAMPAGGEIRIETADTTVTEPINRDRAQVPVGDYAVVRVVDEGVGISADKLAAVFEPFYTTKRTGEGTGLGLSTAYGIIKQTGGFIFVDSKVGQGTCFTLYLPVFAAEPEAPVAVVEPQQPADHGHAEGVVLLVEDEAPVRAFASRALRLRGYTVLEADSAESALETLEDRDLTIDIFITDVVMPGMDGPTWVRKALEDRPGVHVVFVSGYTEGALSEADGKIPNSVFLPKPFSLTQLTETVHRQLH